MTDTKTIILRLKEKGEIEAAERMEALFASNIHLLNEIKLATQELTKIQSPEKDAK